MTEQLKKIVTLNFSRFVCNSLWLLTNYFSVNAHLRLVLLWQRWNPSCVFIKNIQKMMGFVFEKWEKYRHIYSFFYMQYVFIHSSQIEVKIIGWTVDKVRFSYRNYYQFMPTCALLQSSGYFVITFAFIIILVLYLSSSLKHTCVIINLPTLAQ